MSRTKYDPSLAAVYLDEETLKYLEVNPHLPNWKNFIDKVLQVFPNISLHFLVSEKLETIILSSLNGLSNLIFHKGIHSEENFLKEISTILPESKFNDPDWDEVCFLYFKGISPLADVKLMQNAWDRHKKFFSQYSYSENLPEGIIPYILTREFLSTLPDKLPSDVHSFFLKNINQYDVDIFYVPPDLRQYRFDFRLNDRRNSLLIDQLISINPSIVYEELLPTIKSTPNIFRLAPTYIEWEIYKGCELSCTFCPRQFVDKSDEPDYFTVEGIKKSLTNLNAEIKTPYTVCLGGNGEPLLHPNLNEILPLLLQNENTKELIVETALYANVASFMKGLKAIDESLLKKLTVIVNFSTLKPETYTKLYGKNIHSDVLTNIENINSVLPKNSLYVQMIKMVEVGDEVEPYFTFFEKKEINVILQKYNRFAGKLPEKRVSDLTPIHREFCWHLNRDLVIDSKGNVSICKQNQSERLGNILQDSFQNIWEKGHSYFALTFNGLHDKIPAPCLQCDEWYTFNA